MSDYPHLLAPGRIGSMTLRNRIVMSPMGDDLCNPDGTVSEAQHAYAETRARGGVGLVMLGSVAVAHPSGTSNKCQTGISDDRFVPGLRRLASAVHAHGAKIAVQLTHAGKVGINDMIAGRPMLVPSVPAGGDFDPLFTQVTPDEAAKQAAPFAEPTFRIEHREMTPDDIATVIDWFASAAARAGSRHRRCRAARRPRVPARRVPLPRHEPPHGRLRRGGGAPRPAARRDHPGDPRAGRHRVPAVDPHERARVLLRRHDHRRRDHHRQARGGRRGRCAARVDLRRPVEGDRLLGGAHHALPRALRALRTRDQATRRRAGHHRRPHRARRRRPDHRRGQLRLRRHGPQAPRRPRPAQQAAGRHARGHPALHVPLPLHQPDLHP